jgi:hypothetical protein
VVRDGREESDSSCGRINGAKIISEPSKLGQAVTILT